MPGRNDGSTGHRPIPSRRAIRYLLPSHTRASAISDHPRIGFYRPDRHGIQLSPPDPALTGKAEAGDGMTPVF
jgi:hypothetical protein